MRYKIVLERTERYEIGVDSSSKELAEEETNKGLKHGKIILDVPVGIAHIRLIRVYPDSGNGYD